MHHNTPTAHVQSLYVKRQIDAQSAATTATSEQVLEAELQPTHVIHHHVHYAQIEQSATQSSTLVPAAAGSLAG